MRALCKFTLLPISLLFSSCQNNDLERIKIPPFLDIPRAETIASTRVQDIRSPNEKYRIILFDELFPERDISIDTQKQVLENYIEALEKTNWEFFGTAENSHGGTDRVWRFKQNQNDCLVTIRLRLVDYYKEIGDVYFGLESHDRIEFQLNEDLSKPCDQRIISKSFDSDP